MALSRRIRVGAAVAVVSLVAAAPALALDEIGSAEAGDASGCEGAPTFNARSAELADLDTSPLLCASSPIAASPAADIPGAATLPQPVQSSASGEAPPEDALPPFEDDVETAFNRLDDVGSFRPDDLEGVPAPSVPGCTDLVRITLLARLAPSASSLPSDLCPERHERFASLVRAGRVLGVLVNLDGTRTTGFRGVGVGTLAAVLPHSYREVRFLQPDVALSGRKVFVLAGGRVAWVGVTTKVLRHRRSRLHVMTGTPSTENLAPSTSAAAAVSGPGPDPTDDVLLDDSLTR